MQQKLVLKQQQTISLSMLQSLQFLEMTASELEEILKKEQESNPALEITDFYSHSAEVAGSFYAENNMDNLANTMQTTLKDHLRFQLYTGSYSIPLQLAEILIDSIDSKGYLCEESREAALTFGYSQEQVEQTVHVLQQFDPCGVFAKDLAESLLLQLKPSPYKQLAQKIIIHHLQDLACFRFEKIASACRVSVQEVKEACAGIQALNPKPCSGFAEEPLQYIIPDAKVTVKKNALHVSVIRTGRVEINSYYEQCLQEMDTDTQQYILQTISRANWLRRCLEQRYSTLYAVVREIAEMQSAFFLHNQPLKPMTMAEIAQTLSMHESTVSRAVAGKYISYPKGTIALRELFQGQLVEGVSPAMIKEKIKRIIAEEDKCRPLSDLKLSQILIEQGIQVSRRTIAKYRDELSIPTSSTRRTKLAVSL